MKQVYFTFCLMNFSLSGRGGDRARAASYGITEADTEALKPICGWDAPEKLLDCKSPEERLQFAPKALRFRSIAGKRTLVHAVYALPDEVTRREGNYFSHVLLDFPETWNPRKALELWGSPFWRTHDSREIPTTLPEVQIADCKPGIINDESFLAFLQENWHAEMFHFLLQNWLVRGPKEWIVLCCKPEETAFCLWGLTRYLPQYYWNSMTFSTYEKPREILSYDVTTFSTFGEVFQDSEQGLVARLQKQWPMFRVFPRDTPSSAKEFPFIAEWVQLIRDGEGDRILEFFRQVPESNYGNLEAIKIFWNFICHQERVRDQDVEQALRIPGLHALAERIFLSSDNLDLEKAFRFLTLLTPAAQNDLMQRLLREKSLDEIRANTLFSKPLVYALMGRPIPSFQPDKPGQQRAASGSLSRVPIEEVQPPIKPERDSLLYWFFGLFLLLAVIILYYFLILMD